MFLALLTPAFASEKLLELLHDIQDEIEHTREDGARWIVSDADVAKTHAKNVGIGADGKLFTDMPNNLHGKTQSWSKCYKDQECTTLRNQGLAVVRDLSPKRNSCIETECAHYNMNWTGETYDCGAWYFRGRCVCKAGTELVDGDKACTATPKFDTGPYYWDKLKTDLTSETEYTKCYSTSSCMDIMMNQRSWIQTGRRRAGSREEDLLEDDSEYITVKSDVTDERRRDINTYSQSVLRVKSWIQPYVMNRQGRKCMDDFTESACALNQDICIRYECGQYGGTIDMSTVRACGHANHGYMQAQCTGAERY